MELFGLEPEQAIFRDVWRGITGYMSCSDLLTQWLVSYTGFGYMHERNDTSAWYQ